MHNMWFVFLSVLIFLSNRSSGTDKVFSSSESGTDPTEEFWQNVSGEQYILKLNISELENLNRNYSDVYVMFYAYWCSWSIQAKHDFASAAEMIANTKGLSHIRFGAFDCRLTLSNNKMCTKSFKKFKRFPVPVFKYYQSKTIHIDDQDLSINWCPGLTENKYFDWIVRMEKGRHCSENPLSDYYM